MTGFGLTVTRLDGTEIALSGINAFDTLASLMDKIALATGVARHEQQLLVKDVVVSIMKQEESLKSLGILEGSSLNLIRVGPPRTGIWAGVYATATFMYDVRLDFGTWCWLDTECTMLQFELTYTVLQDPNPANLGCSGIEILHGKCATDTDVVAHGVRLKAVPKAVAAAGPGFVETSSKSSRAELAAALLHLYDTDGDGRLNSAELLCFARKIGFGGDAVVWLEHYTLWCARYGWDEASGPNAAELMLLTDDTDYNYLSDAELYTCIQELQPADDAFDARGRSVYEFLGLSRGAMLRFEEGAVWYSDDDGVTFPLRPLRKAA